jgi:hypothetical protein
VGRKQVLLGKWWMLEAPTVPPGSSMSLLVTACCCIWHDLRGAWDPRHRSVQVLRLRRGSLDQYRSALSFEATVQMI